MKAIGEEDIIWRQCFFKCNSSTSKQRGGVKNRGIVADQNSVTIRSTIEEETDEILKAFT